jgi:nitroimidazol reductase NimA-like FMN-containing flavoprotein (pyridoxamine 5'-phosphate oxidase superfamily)
MGRGKLLTIVAAPYHAAMSLAMSRAEREAFLAGVHVGVLAVDEEGRGPLAVPVWYAYQPGGTVDVITAGSSRKAVLIGRAGRFSLCVQTETAPYQYLSVEGPVAGPMVPVVAEQRRAMAHRYLGPELGDLYVEATAAQTEDDVMVSMAPEHWRTTDYTKQFG